ncbi:signal peptidase II [Candidatus Uhrbacteria bacterium]|nr:signal peptidase II [Candidatus Uhrbacteria bacterium]
MSGKIFRGFTAALLAGAAAFLADAWSKAVLFDAITEEGAAFSYLNGFARSTLHHNYGISFNIPLPTWATLLITGLALGWAIAMLVERSRRGYLAACIVLGVVIGGVVGNVFDRITLGFVRDWLLLGGRSAINVADLLIAGSLLAWLILPSKQKGLTDEAV